MVTAPPGTCAIPLRRLPLARVSPPAATFRVSHSGLAVEPAWPDSVIGLAEVRTTGPATCRLLCAPRLSPCTLYTAGCVAPAVPSRRAPAVAVNCPYVPAGTETVPAPLPSVRLRSVVGSPMLWPGAVTVTSRVPAGAGGAAPAGRLTGSGGVTRRPSWALPDRLTVEGAVALGARPRVV